MFMNANISMYHGKYPILANNIKVLGTKVGTYYVRTCVCVYINNVGVSMCLSSP